MSQEQKKRPPMTEEERQRRTRTASERTQEKKTPAGDDHACRSSWCADPDPDRGIHRTVFAQVRCSKGKSGRKAKQEKLIQEEEAKTNSVSESIDQADVMAQGYDYDGAIELLKISG